MKSIFPGELEHLQYSTLFLSSGKKLTSNVLPTCPVGPLQPLNFVGYPNTPSYHLFPPRHIWLHCLHGRPWLPPHTRRHCLRTPPWILPFSRWATLDELFPYLCQCCAYLKEVGWGKIKRNMVIDWKSKRGQFYLEGMRWFRNNLGL
jgi:hypothetical protein